MDDAQKHRQTPPSPIHGVEIQLPCQQTVEQQEKGCRPQLYGSLFIRVQPGDGLADDDDPCIKEGSCQGTEHPSDIAHVSAAAQDPRNQQHATNGNGAAHHFPPRDLFPEDQGCRRQHEHRRHIITQGSDGHRGMVKGFKEKHPVQPQKEPAEQKLRCPVLQFIPMEGDMARPHQEQHGQAAQGSPQECQRHGPQGNVPAHQANRPKNDQGQEHPGTGRKKSKIHGNTILCRKIVSPSIIA